MLLDREHRHQKQRSQMWRSVNICWLMVQSWFPVSNNVYNNSSQKNEAQSHKRIFSRRKSLLFIWQKPPSDPRSRLHVGGHLPWPAGLQQRKREKGCVIHSIFRFPLSTLHLCKHHVLKMFFFFSFMFGTDVHSTSNSLSLPVLIDLVYLYSNDVQSEICSIHWAVKDASLWAYVNANIHLHHTQASCGSLLFRFHCVTS